MRGVVARQVLRRIDVEIEQVVNRVGVLRPVEAMEARGRCERDRRSIQLVFEPRVHRLVDGRLRASHAGRRHHPRTHFADDEFELLGLWMEIRKIDVVDCQLPGRVHARRLRLFAVAVDTVAGEQVVFGGGGQLAAGRTGRRGDARRRGRRSRNRSLGRRQDHAAKSNECSDDEFIHPTSKNTASVGGSTVRLPVTHTLLNVCRYLRYKRFVYKSPSWGVTVRLATGA